jgi:hypothetical protein
MGSYTLREAELLALLSFLRSRQPHDLPPEMAAIIPNLEFEAAANSNSGPSTVHATSGYPTPSPTPQPAGHTPLLSSGAPTDASCSFQAIQPDGQFLSAGDPVSILFLLSINKLNISILAPYSDQQL